MSQFHIVLAAIVAEILLVGDGVLGQVVDEHVDVPDRLEAEALEDRGGTSTRPA